MHPHLLRHAFVTELVVRQKVDAQTVADLAGHSTPATTLRYYTHTDEPAREAAADALSQAWKRGAVSVSASSEHQSGTVEPAVVEISTARRKRKPA